MKAQLINLAYQLLKQRQDGLRRELKMISDEQVKLRQEVWNAVLQGRVINVATGKQINPETDIGCGLVSDCTTALLEGQLPIEASEDGTKVAKGYFKGYLFEIPVED